MHWGQIKTLLIVSFLILDVYLFMQVMEKKEEADIGILEQEPSTIEEQLKAESITYKNLPDEVEEETYISVTQRSFHIEELKEEDPYSNQDTTLLTQHVLLSQLDKPVEIDENINLEEMGEIFKDIVYYADEYTYWNWNKEANVIVLFQRKEGLPIYYNQNGLVLLFLNDKNEITYYVQTMLDEAETLAEKKKLMEPIRAIETLYNANELKPGDMITKVSLGFHTRVPFEAGVQVFAPIWKVNVNGERDYFVNAIEGFTFSSSENDFLTEVIDVTLAKTEDRSKFEKLVKDLQDRLRSIETSG